jgi:hypothetical protein
MPIQLRQAHPKVKGHRGKVSITRGPLVYCLESVDNPNVDIFSVAIEPKSLEAVFERTSLGGITKIIGQVKTGQPLTFRSLPSVGQSRRVYDDGLGQRINKRRHHAN